VLIDAAKLYEEAKDPKKDSNALAAVQGYSDEDGLSERIGCSGKNKR
jgi:hypothetical protein